MTDMRKILYTEPRASEITAPKLFFSRRDLLRGAAATALTATGIASFAAAAAVAPPNALRYVKNGKFQVPEKLTPYQFVTGYNNFYEFGTDKEDPAANAQSFSTSPWFLSVSGECEAPGKFTLEDILRPHPLEERIYRHRCVEAWSMVIPWVGFPLGDLLRRFRPTARAKYVELKTLHDPKSMPGQRFPVLQWPYTEALRIDEAMHPLAILAVGVYGRALPNQNGAPLRLVVPWKYGFKSIKSIVGVRFTEHMPRTSWSEAGPDEYGFFANVNPEVDHPRWSQAKERRIGESLFASTRDTLMFNGYADQVASLYAGMNLRRWF
jgi:methionine sulfoxide reductase catalytic subunit